MIINRNHDNNHPVRQAPSLPGCTEGSGNLPKVMADAKWWGQGLNPALLVAPTKHSSAGGVGVETGREGGRQPSPRRNLSPALLHL